VFDLWDTVRECAGEQDGSALVFAGLSDGGEAAGCCGFRTCHGACSCSCSCDYGPLRIQGRWGGSGRCGGQDPMTQIEAKNYQRDNSPATGAPMLIPGSSILYSILESLSSSLRTETILQRDYCTALGPHGPRDPRT